MSPVNKFLGWNNLHVHVASMPAANSNSYNGLLVQVSAGAQAPEYLSCKFERREAAYNIHVHVTLGL